MRKKKMDDPSQDQSLVELFRKRSKDTKKEQGGVGTLMAMRGAFRVPRPQMDPRARGYLPNWSAEVYRDAVVRGSKVTRKDANGT